MTDPIDLLDEASWLYDPNRAVHVLDHWPLHGPVRGERTVGDLRHVLALARDAGRLRAALPEALNHEDVREIEAAHVYSPPSYNSPDGLGWCSCGEDCEASTLLDAIQRARAALEGTDR